jgi:hypothetical protein
MKTSPPRFLALVLVPICGAALAVVTLSCSGDSTNTGDGGGGGHGSGGNRGSGGSGNPGSGGSGNPGSGGNRSGTGGSGNPGSGGSGNPGTGGSSSGSGGSSGGGSGGAGMFMMNCTPAAPLISDMEDGLFYYGNGCPKGGWFLDTAGAGTITTDTSTAWTMPSGSYSPTTCMDSANTTSTKCIHVSGSGQKNSGAMMYDAHATLSAALNQPETNMAGSLNASAYTGVQFYGKVTGNVVLQVSNADTDPHGGKCSGSAATQCYDHAEKMLPVSSSWMLYKIAFSDLMQEGFGNKTASPFPKSAIYSIVFKIPVPDFSAMPNAAPAWDLWVDDLSFY